MDNSIFRKKSIERISSPEQLNNYIKVASIPSWVILIVILILLFATIVWGVVGKVNTYADVLVVSDGKKIEAYVLEEDGEYVKAGMPIEIDGNKYTLSERAKLPIKAKDNLSDYELHMSKFGDDDYTYVYDVLGDLEEGAYDANVVIDSVHPIEYLWN